MPDHNVNGLRLVFLPSLETSRLRERFVGVIVLGGIADTSSVAPTSGGGTLAWPGGAVVGTGELSTKASCITWDADVV